MAKYSIEESTLSGIADAIRGKTGKAATMKPLAMAAEIEAIETSTTPEITVSSGGLITAKSGPKSSTKQLATQAAKTVTPTTSKQTAVASGVYTTGAIEVAAIPSAYKDVSGVTAAAADVLSGKVFVNAAGTKVTGSMADKGAVSQSINAGGSYTIPAGYHNGSGKVTGNSLASQTAADASAADILSGKTAWVNGAKVLGTLAKGVQGTPATLKADVGNMYMSSFSTHVIAGGPGYDKYTLSGTTLTYREEVFIGEIDGFPVVAMRSESGDTSMQKLVVIQCSTGNYNWKGTKTVKGFAYKFSDLFGA